MPKIKFCPQCQNNFSNYSYVTEKENNKPVNYLVYTCQSCLYTEKMSSVKDFDDAMLFTKNNLNKLPDKEINADMCLDPTMPHTSKVLCPNKSCPSYDEKTKKDVVFFHYNTEMKIAYICCLCRSFWKVE